MSLLAVLLLTVTSCSVGGSGDTTAEEPSLRTRAVDFAASADRALAGTRFESASIDDLARAIESICANGSSFDEAVSRAVDGLADEQGPAADDEVAAEVLVAGVVDVCPGRVGGLTALDLYLRAVESALGGVAVGRDAVLDAGPGICEVLDAGGGAERALLFAASALFGVSVDGIEALPGAGVTPDLGLVIGATVAAAVEYLCPAHREVIREFTEGLGG